MMKFLYPIVLIAATSTTTIVATPAGIISIDPVPCCQCDKDNSIYDIIMPIESIDGRDRDGMVRRLQTNEQGDGTSGGLNGGTGGGEQTGIIGNDGIGDMQGECCPCPSKLLVTDEESCLSSREKDVEEEFCRGTPISVIGASDLINMGADMMYEAPPDLGDDDGRVRFLTTRAALEELALLSKVITLAEICRGGDELPRGGNKVLDAVRLALHDMELPDFVPERLNPEFIIGGSPDNATARLRLLELQQLLEADVMARMEGRLELVGLPTELQELRPLP